MSFISESGGTDIAEELIHECLVHNNDFARIVHLCLRKSAAEDCPQLQRWGIALTAKLKDRLPFLGVRLPP